MNRAFIIDNSTKEALIAEDPRSAEILKPVLRGRDIRRYQANWDGLWLIATFPAVKLTIDNYPAVKRHLLSFGRARLEQEGKALPDGTRSRKRTRHAWFELQDTCAYYANFADEKLFWMDMSNEGRFAYSDDELFCNDKGFMMTGDNLKYLCAVLNSALVAWLMKNTGLTTGMGLMQWKKFAVERIPIPRVSAARQRPFIALVDKILKTKGANPRADTNQFEKDIDSLVVDLYRLTRKEALVVERIT